MKLNFLTYFSLEIITKKLQTIFGITANGKTCKDFSIFVVNVKLKINFKTETLKLIKNDNGSKLSLVFFIVMIMFMKLK